MGREKVLELKRMFGRLIAASAIGGVTAITLGFVLCLSGARFNTTSSIPLGLYWISSAPMVSQARSRLEQEFVRVQDDGAAP